jgi:hypothetical protein
VTHSLLKIAYLLLDRERGGLRAAPAVIPQGCTPFSHLVAMKRTKFPRGLENGILTCGVARVSLKMAHSLLDRERGGPQSESKFDGRMVVLQSWDTTSTTTLWKYCVTSVPSWVDVWRGVDRKLSHALSLSTPLPTKPTTPCSPYDARHRIERCGGTLTRRETHSPPPFRASLLLASSAPSDDLWRGTESAVGFGLRQQYFHKVVMLVVSQVPSLKLRGVYYWKNHRYNR